MKEEMKKLLAWLNEEKAKAVYYKKSQKERNLSPLEDEVREQAFSECIEKIKEICGCDGK